MIETSLIVENQVQPQWDQTQCKDTRYNMGAKNNCNGSITSSASKHPLQQKRSFIEDEGNSSSENNIATSEEFSQIENSEAWQPSSWRSYPALQQPIYENTEMLNEQLQLLSELPSIVSVEEIDNLSADLKLCERGEAFFIQMGDCAERFVELNDAFMEKKIKAITATSRIFANILNKKCVKIGRIAGQYAKPRSQEYEKLPDGTLQFNYRGDNVNSLQQRKPDPMKLTSGYNHSVAAMNYIRTQHSHIIKNKLNIHQMIDDKHYPQKETQANKELALNQEELNAIENSTLNNYELYSSHEGLLLNYEETMTKKFDDKFYNTSTHLLWLGERTRQIDGAHLEFFSGIQNPVAVKVGPTTDGFTLKQLVQKLNPNNIQGRLIIICRMGNNNIQKVLPNLIKAKQQYNLNFTWSCDPMHGNTFSTSKNIKTRNVKDILEELTKFANILHQHNEVVGGIHLETSPNQVTECLGLEIEESDLGICYTSACDPRLNISQTLYISYQFALILQSLYSNNSAQLSPVQQIQQQQQQ